MSGVGRGGDEAEGLGELASSIAREEGVVVGLP